MWVTVHTFISHLSGADGMCSHQLRAELPSCGGGKSPPCRAASGTQQSGGCLNPTVKFKDAQRTHLSMQIFPGKFFHCSFSFSLDAGGFPFLVFPYKGALPFPFTSLSTVRHPLIAGHHISRPFTCSVKGLRTVPPVSYTTR